MSVVCLSWFLVGAFILGLLILSGLIVAAILLTAKRSSQQGQSTDPASGEHVKRISREIEKINEMQAAGRISAGEANELKMALEGERREWAGGSADFIRKRLTKSRNRILAGICGGLAEWLGCDVTLLRVIYAVLTLFSAAFPGIILYIIMWIFMPPPEAPSLTGDK